MYNSMIFPATVDEFMEEYKVVDSEHVYSNGMEMVPIFRMKQWFEHEANHNAEPGKMVDDTVSRQAAMESLMGKNVIMDGSEYHNGFNAGVNRAQEVIRNLPPVQPKQTNCEYCHTDRDGYVFPLEKNSHAFIDRDKIVLKAKGWRGEAKIKYCPICGRRLTDG